jgi:Protein of unknown function (DUF2934)
MATTKGTKKRSTAKSSTSRQPKPRATPQSPLLTKPETKGRKDVTSASKVTKKRSTAKSSTSRPTPQSPLLAKPETREQLDVMATTKRSTAEFSASQQPTSQPSLITTSDKDLYDRVAQRAYELYQARGEDHGNDLTDWFTAEQLVKEELLHGPVLEEPLVDEGE